MAEIIDSDAVGSEIEESLDMMEGGNEEVEETEGDPVPEETEEVESEETEEEPAEEEQEETEEGEEKPAEPKPEEKEEEKKYEVTIDGEKKQVTLDELQRGYMRASAASKRFEEAASLRKELDSFVGAMKADPINFLAQELFPSMGLDFREVAENYLIPIIEEETRLQAMDPRERKAFEAERKLKQYEEQQRQAQEQHSQAQIEREAAQIRETLTKEWGEALTTAGLPANAGIIARMAYHAEIALNNEQEPDVAHLIDIVREELAALGQAPKAKETKPTEKPAAKPAPKKAAPKPPATKPMGEKALSQKPRFYGDREMEQKLRR